ncbi:hypothetical protein [Rosistilla oblonga]|uniref:hypothetical protein n=1 Tax=Rosistilla oblonga TaxID=2527990 RepID=UPI003A97F281
MNEAACASQCKTQLATKSALIWNDIDELLYAVVDGDWSRFQTVYINGTDSIDLRKELERRVCGEEGEYLIKFCGIYEFTKAIRDGAVAVECGFLM